MPTSAACKGLAAEGTIFTQILAAAAASTAINRPLPWDAAMIHCLLSVATAS